MIGYWKTDFVDCKPFVDIAKDYYTVHTVCQPDCTAYKSQQLTTYTVDIDIP